jgi:RNA polymerase sigma-70 factor (ECF subfamily)
MKNDEPRDDVELLSVISSNPAALEQFYRRHVDDVTRFLARRCRTPEDVADAVSATFLAILLSAETFDPTLGSPMAWLFSIARNKATGQGRTAGRREALRLRLRGSALLSRSDTERIDELIDAEREASHLEETLRNASSGELELLNVMVRDDLAVGEAATSLGVSASTGRKRLQRLRRGVVQPPDQNPFRPLPQEQ